MPADPPISFARGAPAPELLAADELADCAREVGLRDGARVFSYGPAGGYAPLREWVAARHGVAADRVVLTVGGLLGFVLYAGEMLERRPGRVLVEAPSYDRPLKILAREGAEIVPLAMDDEGLDPDALAAELARTSEPASFLYTIPTFQNPSGRTLSTERRQLIAELVEAHALPVLEDDPYSLVRFEGEPAPALHELVPGDLVTYTSSFSKTVAPGVRTGYFVVPADAAAAFEERAASTYISPPFLAQATVFEFIRRERLRAEPRARPRGASRQAGCDARRARALLPAGRGVEPAGRRLLRLARPSGRCTTRPSSPRAPRARASRSCAERTSSHAAPGSGGRLRGWPTASSRRSGSPRGSSGSARCSSSTRSRACGVRGAGRRDSPPRSRCRDRGR